MSGPTSEDEVRRTLRAKAAELEVEARAFDPDVGSVVELDDARGRRSRRTVWTALVAAAVIVAVIAVAVAVRSPGSSKPEVGDTPSTIPDTTTTLGMVSHSQPAPAALVEQVTSVPRDWLWQVGAANPNPMPGSAVLPGPLLRSDDGKVRIIWIGAEYCPFCAAERWPLIIALARFGTFSDLRITSSAAETPVGSPEVFPSTQSFSFHGARYESDDIDFEAAETEDNRFRSLDELTPEQLSIFDKYDRAPFVAGGNQGAIPFIDIANQQLVSGAQFNASVLAGRSVQDIADALMDPKSEIAKSVYPAALKIAESICSLNDGTKLVRIPACDGLTSESAPTGPTGGTGSP